MLYLRKRATLAFKVCARTECILSDMTYGFQDQARLRFLGAPKRPENPGSSNLCTPGQIDLKAKIGFQNSLGQIHRGVRTRSIWQRDSGGASRGSGGARREKHDECWLYNLRGIHRWGRSSQEKAPLCVMFPPHKALARESVKCNKLKSSNPEFSDFV